MNEKPNYYAVIPSQVRYDKDLTPNEKLLYGEITALTNRSGECWATNKYFSELYNVHINTASIWIQHLKDKGYIQTKIQYKNNTKEIEKRVIKINGEPINKNIKTYQQKCGEGINENIERGINKNVEENNTSINNTRLIKEIYKEKFEMFYSEYPRKVKKANVEKWFYKNKPNDELFEKMMIALNDYKRIWTDKQFIPYPDTWLNQKRWEDEIEHKQTKEEILQEMQELEEKGLL